MSHWPLVRKLIHEHEAEGGKLRPQVVLYMTPDQLNKGRDNDQDFGPGACCGKCAMFNTETSNCMLTAPAHCNAEHGVCGLFAGGEHFNDEPQELISKDDAGYVEKGPTRCGSCEYYTSEGENAETGECKKVGDTTIYRDGCCNGWEPNDEEEEG